MGQVQSVEKNMYQNGHIFFKSSQLNVHKQLLFLYMNTNQINQWEINVYYNKSIQI